MIRWILALVALAIGAWYLTDRRRRAQIEDPWRDTAPSELYTQPGAGQASPSGDGKTPSGSVQTDTDVAPSVHDTVQAELSDVAEKVENLKDQAQAPTDAAEKSAATALGSGTVAGTDLKTASTPGTADEGIVPEGRRPRRIAGEGTTTAADTASDRHTSTGVSEPLPPGLTPGEPGTGGPAGSSLAPSEPGSSETPTTGMVHAPVVDREEILKRTSGNFVGNKHTRIFHAATSANLPVEENRVYFETEEEALAAGFRPSARKGPDSAES